MSCGHGNNLRRHYCASEPCPKTARRLDHDGHETDINAEDVLPGDKLRIRPGESIPVDGIVIEGKQPLMIDGDRGIYAGYQNGG
ncbi:hypothetical protein OIP13_00040 [Citrobacter freundii]|nr:hypothetical protein [Citrobacter freundii]